MKKRIVPMLMIVLLAVSISLVASVDFENAYGQGQEDEVIYDTIRFDYCVVTGLTDQEADDVFAKLDEYDQSTTELVEDTFPDCNSTYDLEGTILYLQSNYESAKNAMIGHEEELDAYLLFNSIEYYKDNYDFIEQRVEDTKTASATASNGSEIATVIPDDVTQFLYSYLDTCMEHPENAVDYVHFESDIERDAFCRSHLEILDYEILGEQKINDRLYAFTLKVVKEYDTYPKRYYFVGLIDNELYLMVNAGNVPEVLQDGFNKDDFALTSADLNGAIPVSPDSIC